MGSPCSLGLLASCGPLHCVRSVGRWDEPSWHFLVVLCPSLYGKAEPELEGWSNTLAGLGCVWLRGRALAYSQGGSEFYPQFEKQTTPTKNKHSPNTLKPHWHKIST